MSRVTEGREGASADSAECLASDRFATPCSSPAKRRWPRARSRRAHGKHHRHDLVTMASSILVRCTPSSSSITRFGRMEPSRRGDVRGVADGCGEPIARSAVRRPRAGCLCPQIRLAGFIADMWKKGVSWGPTACESRKCSSRSRQRAAHHALAGADHCLAAIEDWAGDLFPVREYGGDVWLGGGAPVVPPALLLLDANMRFLRTSRGRLPQNVNSALRTVDARGRYVSGWCLTVQGAATRGRGLPR